MVIINVLFFAPAGGHLLKNSCSPPATRWPEEQDDLQAVHGRVVYDAAAITGVPPVIAASV
jgi:hypothetical protein